jgi:hypothetical protein
MKSTLPAREQTQAPLTPSIRLHKVATQQARRANRQTPDRREAVCYAMLRTG